MCAFPIAGVADAVQQSCIWSRAQLTAGGYVAGNAPHGELGAERALHNCDHSKDVNLAMYEWYDALGLPGNAPFA